MKKYAVLCILTLMVSNLFAQANAKLNPLTPPPPNVSALGRFAIQPIGNFTGVPDITIPIYTIQEGTLTFPVAIRYHAGGNKVKDEASEIGLGWALSAGGFITSITRGQADFQGNGFRNKFRLMPNAPKDINKKRKAASNVDSLYYLWTQDAKDFPQEGLGSYSLYPRKYLTTGLSLPWHDTAREYFNDFNLSLPSNTGTPDFASDLYLLAIGDKSYSFILDNTLKPIVLGDGSLKIELINRAGDYPDWKVTDEQGIEYYYTERQYFYSSSSPIEHIIGLTPHLNTWHLTKIKSPTYGEITFKYLHYTNQFVKPLPALVQTELVENTTTLEQQLPEVSAEYTVYEQLNIDTISFTSGYMKFIYADDRADLIGARRLQKIEVREAGNNTVIKKMEFDNNAYFSADADPSIANKAFQSQALNMVRYAFPSDNINKRLKLNSISEIDPLVQDNVKKYNFFYHEKVSLPPKLSFSIDHWGYFNGAANNQFLPSGTESRFQNASARNATGNNRDAYPGFMQADILTKIQYPTGGATEYTYETNSYTKNGSNTYYGGLRISEVKDSDPVARNSKSKRYNYVTGAPDAFPVYESEEGHRQSLGSAHTIGHIRNVSDDIYKYHYGQSVYSFSDGKNTSDFGYKQVRITEGENGNENGMTEYTYATDGNIDINQMLRTSLHNTEMANPVLSQIPDIQVGLRGKLLEEKKYKLHNASLVPVSGTHYYYTNENTDTLWQMIFDHGFSSIKTDVHFYKQVYKIYAHQFAIPVQRNMLKKVEQTEYDEAGNPALTKFEVYQYDKQNGHYKLIKVTAGTSREDTLNTYYRFPQDYNNLSGITNLDSVAKGIQLLQQKHIITPVEMYKELVLANGTTKKYIDGSLNVYNAKLPVLNESLILVPTATLSFTASTISNGTFTKSNAYKIGTQFTKYDSTGHLLEQELENGSTNAFVWDYKNAYIIAKVESAGAADIAYTSFEADGAGNWSSIKAKSIVTDAGITGRKYYNLSSSDSLKKTGLNSAAMYIVSYWSKDGAYAVTGTQSGWPQKIRTVIINGQDWSYYEHKVTGVATLYITGSGAIDELRLYPASAQMTTYTYYPLVGVTSQCDVNNRILNYEYDGRGRLILVRDENKNILKKIDYTDQGEDSSQNR